MIDDLKRVIHFANLIIESPDNFPFGIEHPIYSMIKILNEIKEDIEFKEGDWRLQDEQ